MQTLALASNIRNVINMEMP